MPVLRNGALGTRTGWASALAVAILAAVLVSPAAAGPAPNNCDGTGTPAVEFLAIQSAQNSTMMGQTDGSYATKVRARVFCQDGSLTDLGEVLNAQVAVWIQPLRPAEIKVNGQVATESNPVSISAPNGFADVTISSTDPNILNLAQGEWKAKVGYEWTAVASAFGSGVSIDDSPRLRGTLWAQTPELGSRALFGTGAAGMAGYALTRLRARNGRRG